MGMESLALAFLLLTANGGAEPETFHMKSLKMSIPITIVPEKRNELRELLLFCSRDEGKNWNQVGLATPEQTSFPFLATGDGKYWFTIQTVDKNGLKDPANLYTAPVGQRIVVDTVKPLVKVKAERKGDEVQASWEVTEEHPNAATFVLEYHLADQPSAIWRPVPAIPGATGNTTFRPESTAAVTVQLRVKDQAENEGAGTAEVVAGSPSTAGTTGVTPGNQWSMTPAPPPVPPPSPTHLAPPPPPLHTGPAVATPMRGALPNVQVVNRKEVKLDFDVTKLGPSGLGAVEVYVTMDEGTNWNLQTLDPTAVQPPEARGPGQAHGSVTVIVPEDGRTYGFYLRVMSKANLGKPKPERGDAPHIRIERDTVSPSATIFVPQPDTTRRDTLILSWKAEDKNLTPAPISLAWSPRKEGPWEFIGTPEMPNTGRFAWQVPSHAPPSVYLKMTVSDTAGNVTVAQTPEPVLVDLSIPEVNSVNIAPIR